MPLFESETFLNPHGLDSYQTGNSLWLGEIQLLIIFRQLNFSIRRHVEGQHGVEYNDKPDGKWALKKKKRRIEYEKSDNNAKLLWRVGEKEFEVASGPAGALKFRVPLKRLNSVKKTAPKPARKRKFDFIDDEAEEASQDSEEASSEIEIPEDLENGDDDKYPSLESLP